MKELRRRLVFGITLAVALVVGGVLSAYATGSIPGPDGVFHACFDNTNGVVRLIDPSASTCRTNESAISWNQAGPPGPQGPVGAAGPPGPSNAWVARAGVLDMNRNVTTTVLSIKVPAGSYVIAAKVPLVNLAGTMELVTCNLSTGDSSTIRLSQTFTGGDAQVITLMDAATFASDSTISLTCLPEFETGAFKESILSAVQVGTLH